ncbi:MAG: TPM domain-containing protein [Vicinamibacterales bacterium]
MTSPSLGTEHRRSCWLVALMVPLLVAAMSAEPLSSIPNPRTRDGTWVTDMPRALRAETVARLNATLGDLERTSTVEMAVVVVSSLDSLSVEETAARLFQLWGIGKKSQDNGLLLLWSRGDRRVRVEVGYGLEGALPDGKVGAILDTYVIPKFKAGDFDQGLIDGVDALIRVARAEPIALMSAKSESYDRRPWGIGGGVASIAAAIVASIGSITGFRRWRRYRRRRCPACGTLMTRLGEIEDDALLAEGQQAEERIGSVDYDVWKCGGCSHHFTLRYPKWMSRYAKCPQCGNSTKSSTQTVIEAATTTGSGSAQVVDQCAFCSFRQEYTKVLPRIQPSSSSEGSSGGGSSFGGGSSGGGGASRGY